jgi:hypothetical protein
VHFSERSGASVSPENRHPQSTGAQILSQWVPSDIAGNDGDEDARGGFTFGTDHVSTHFKFIRCGKYLIVRVGLIVVTIGKRGIFEENILYSAILWRRTGLPNIEGELFLSE